MSTHTQPLVVEDRTLRYLHAAHLWSPQKHHHVTCGCWKRKRTTLNGSNEQVPGAQNGSKTKFRALRSWNEPPKTSSRPRGGVRPSGKSPYSLLLFSHTVPYLCDTVSRALRESLGVGLEASASLAELETLLGRLWIITCHSTAVRVSVCWVSVQSKETKQKQGESTVRGATHTPTARWAERFFRL